jgi:hypothetical protein
MIQSSILFGENEITVHESYSPHVNTTIRRYTNGHHSALVPEENVIVLTYLIRGNKIKIHMTRVDNDAACLMPH